MSSPKNRERAERMLDLSAQLQEASMKLLLTKIADGTATAADIKIAMDTADKAGLIIDPDAFPQSLKDRLTKTVDPKKFADDDADIEAGNRNVQ